MNKILDCLRSEFAFLERDYGFQLQKSSMDQWDRKWAPRLVFVNSSTGARVQYEVSDGYLSVMLYRLRDGRLPERDGRIDPEEGYSLTEVLELKRALETLLTHDDPDEQSGGDGTQAFEDEVGRNARAMKEYADSILRGDFGSWPELRKIRTENLRARGWPAPSATNPSAASQRSAKARVGEPSGAKPKRSKDSNRKR